MSIAALIELAAAITVMVALPLTPALRELFERHDANPLPIRSDDRRIRNFEAQFRRYIEPALRDPEAFLDSDKPALLRDGVPAVVLTPEQVESLKDLKIDYLALLPSGGTIGSRNRFVRDLYSGAALSAGPDNAFRAALIDGDAFFGERMILLRWLHVSGNLRVGADSRLCGRVSAGGTIRLAPDCRFARVESDEILVGAELSEEWEINTRPSSIIDRRVGRICTRGNFHLSAGDMVEGHIVANGTIILGEGVRITGCVKSHTCVSMDRNVAIEGAVLSSGGMNIAGDSFLSGPILCEGELVIGPNTCIGSQSLQTTVSASRIRIAPKAAIHGTLWARELGVVAP